MHGPIGCCLHAPPFPKRKARFCSHFLLQRHFLPRRPGILEGGNVHTGDRFDTSSQSNSNLWIVPTRQAVGPWGR